jgi:hypothetical protein
MPIVKAAIYHLYKFLSYLKLLFIKCLERIVTGILHLLEQTGASWNCIKQHASTMGSLIYQPIRRLIGTTLKCIIKCLQGIAIICIMMNILLGWGVKAAIATIKKTHSNPS